MRALIVDGYNALHAWPTLRPMMDGGRLADARERLIGLLADHAAATGLDITVVFDSHGATGPGEVTKEHGITVRYGTAAATADHVIERMAHLATRSGPDRAITVATSDRLQRELVFAMGVAVMTTQALCAEVDETIRATQSIADAGRQQALITRRLEDSLDPDVRSALERMRRGDMGVGPADDDGPDTGD